MKKLVAIIRPFRLDEVRDRLWEVGVRGITVTEVRLCKSPGFLGDLGISSDLVPRLMVEVVVPSGMVEDVVEVFEDLVEDSDGYIYTLSVEDAIRIRTGERGEGVL